jgi:hypothetical protein
MSSQIPKSEKDNGFLIQVLMDEIVEKFTDLLYVCIKAIMYLMIFDSKF